MPQNYRMLPVISRRVLMTLALFACMVLPVGVSASTLAAGNGIVAHIHAGDDLAPYLHHEDGAWWLRHPGVGEIELFLGPDDPRFPRHGVDAFLPLDGDVVLQALSDVHTVRAAIEVDVFLLPSPPVITGSSFARRNAIVLAPSFGPIADSAIASVTVHELGHVLTWGYFDHRPRVWDEYMSLRGLDSERNGSSAAHADRAREILAEDIRYLFGGGLANVYHNIENAEIALPDEVTGLSAYLARIIDGRPSLELARTCRAFPNPCNPRTTIELALSAHDADRDAGSARLEVYDMRGRLVRSVMGGMINNGHLLMTWDGHEDDGRSAATGRYMYVAGWSDLKGRGSVMLVK